MSIAGIIAEFNPLHNGHEYIINQAKNDGNTVACVISGNFVQRGDVAIIPKFIRAKSALLCGADIILELPVPWSMSTAQNFAFGAVSQLSAINIDCLYFGSECGDSIKLSAVADALLSNKFSQIISSELKTGKTFAKIRTEAVRKMIGNDANILESPNDALAVEYICAAKKLGLNLEFHAVKRIGAGHNDTVHKDIYSTATLIRKAILNNEYNYVRNFMPEQSAKLLFSSPVADIERIDKAIITVIKMLSMQDLCEAPDISEGLDGLIYKKARVATCFSELCELVKSKRYTLARIRRILLSAFLRINKEYFLTEPPYVRVLGFSEDGIKLVKTSGSKHIITKISEIQKLNEPAKKLFELENKANEIYALSLDRPEAFVDERSEKIIIV